MTNPTPLDLKGFGARRYPGFAAYLNLVKIKRLTLKPMLLSSSHSCSAITLCETLSNAERSSLPAEAGPSAKTDSNPGVLRRSGFVNDLAEVPEPGYEFYR